MVLLYNFFAKISKKWAKFGGKSTFFSNFCRFFLRNFSIFFSETFQIFWIFLEEFLIFFEDFFEKSRELLYKIMDFCTKVPLLGVGGLILSQNTKVYMVLLYKGGWWVPSGPQNTKVRTNRAYMSHICTLAPPRLNH